MDGDMGPIVCMIYVEKSSSKVFNNATNRKNMLNLY